MIYWCRRFISRQPSVIPFLHGSRGGFKNSSDFPMQKRKAVRAYKGGKTIDAGASSEGQKESAFYYLLIPAGIVGVCAAGMSERAAANGLITHLSDGLCFLYVYVADRDVTLGDNKLRDINNPLRWPAFDDAHCARTHTQGNSLELSRERLEKIN
jgi:hypothetical protein